MTNKSDRAVASGAGAAAGAADVSSSSSATVFGTGNPEAFGSRAMPEKKADPEAAVSSASAAAAAADEAARLRMSGVRSVDLSN